MKKIKPGWVLALVGTLGIVLAIFSPAFLPESTRIWVMRAFDPVCHQLPLRSPHISGVQLAVCHRCLGIYMAIPLAVVLFLFTTSIDPLIRRKAGPCFALSLVPIGLDWGLNISQLWHNTAASRLATGAVFGLCAGYFLALGLYALFDKPAESVGEPQGLQS